MAFLGLLTLNINFLCHSIYLADKVDGQGKDREVCLLRGDCPHHKISSHYYDNNGDKSGKCRFFRCNHKADGKVFAGYDIPVVSGVIELVAIDSFVYKFHDSGSLPEESLSDPPERPPRV